jgi:hypothetical protein
MSSLAIFLAATAASAAKPQADGQAKIQGAFGNTILETFPDGRTARIWLARDGSYTGEGRRHDKSGGRWSVRGTQLCFKQTHPFAFGYTFCTPIPDVGMGQPWTAKAPTGEQITVKVVEGRAAN